MPSRQRSAMLALMLGNMMLDDRPFIIKRTIEPNTDELWQVPKRQGSPYGKKQRRHKKVGR